MYQRVIVTGSIAAGKTTLARTLAGLLGGSHVEMDCLRHAPNWVDTPDDVFREQVSKAISGDVWVVDSDYRAVRDIVWPRADTLVWLDYKFRTALPRLLKRTFRRCITREELWNGNRETFYQHLFTRESILLEALRKRGRDRIVYEALLLRPEYAHVSVVRMSSPSATHEWLSSLSPNGRVAQ